MAEPLTCPENTPDSALYSAEVSALSVTSSTHSAEDALPLPFLPAGHGV